MTGLETEGGRIRGVRTANGRIAADHVVIALGSFTAPLLRPLGIRLPIYPVKGMSITFPRGDWDTAPRMPVIDDSKIFGLVPIGDRLRISGSAEVAGYDAAPAETRGAGNRRQRRLHLPRDPGALPSAGPPGFWGGLRPVTPSGTPIIGPTAIRGLWVNAGHGHLGWTLACGSGRVLAELLDGRKPSVAAVADHVLPGKAA